VFSPLLGLAALLFIPRTKESLIKRVGFLATLVPLFSAVWLYSRIRSGRTYGEFAQSLDWLQFGHFPMLEGAFVVRYELGISGLSLAMILLTAVLSSLSAAASMYIKHEWKGYFMLFLLLEVGMLGVFAAENLILFFIFFEVTLIPMFFLIGKWGYFDREKAAYTFLLYNGLGSAILLVVIITLFARTGTSNIALLTELLARGSEAQTLLPLSQAVRTGLLLALLVAFGIKLPIFPLHTWMLQVHVQAPPAIVMLHSGVLLKIGAFGFIRFGLGLFPQEFQTIAGAVAILGIVNLLYGAFLAFTQTDFKQVLAYSSVSHMGIVLMGLGSLTEAGMQGAIFQVVSHGFISALLFFLVGVFYERVHTSAIPRLGGLAKTMPAASGFLLAGAMASIGLPGMSGFISEFMAFLGLFKVRPVLGAVGTIGIIMTAVYLLKAVLNITFGNNHSSYDHVTDLKKTEVVPAAILLGFIILIGVYPAILTELIQSSIQSIDLGTGG
jgi:NADH-quinone oxidoreductase subunit M